MFNFSDNKFYQVSTDTIYKHGNFPQIPDDPDHCGFYNYEKQKENIRISLESVKKGHTCSA